MGYVFGGRHLRHLFRQFTAHYHAERYHQGLDGKLIRPNPVPANDNRLLGAIASTARLGGLLNFYFRVAA